MWAPVLEDRQTWWEGRQHSQLPTFGDAGSTGQRLHCPSCCWGRVPHLGRPRGVRRTEEKPSGLNYQVAMGPSSVGIEDHRFRFLSCLARPVHQLLHTTTNVLSNFVFSATGQACTSPAPIGPPPPPPVPVLSACIFYSVLRRAQLPSFNTFHSLIRFAFRLFFFSLSSRLQTDSPLSSYSSPFFSSPCGVHYQ